MTENCLQVAGNGWILQVEFLRPSDRWQHVISLAKPVPDRPLTFVPLFVSLEGAAQDAWPASPVLQNLHFEQLSDNRRAALLVGMAGRSHWSASIEAAGEGCAVLFDIACRVSQTAEFLGSTYEVSSEFQSAAHRTTVVGEQAGDFAPPQIEVREQRLAIVSSTRAERTIRWKYRIAVEGN